MEFTCEILYCFLQPYSSPLYFYAMFCSVALLSKEVGSLPSLFFKSLQSFNARIALTGWSSSLACLLDPDLLDSFHDLVLLSVLLCGAKELKGKGS